MIPIQHKGMWWLGTALAGAALLTLFLFNPVSVSWYPPCILHRLTGLDCPGCGSARGLHSLLHGELSKAAEYNVMLFLALPLLASGFYNKLTGRGQGLWNSFNKPRLLLWIIGLFWILRNIPGQPLSWLNAGW